MNIFKYNLKYLCLTEDGFMQKTNIRIKLYASKKFIFSIIKTKLCEIFPNLPRKIILFLESLFYIETYFIKLLEFLQPFFPKDTYVLMDNLYEKTASCIDTYAIHKYMQNHNMRSYYVIWKENISYKKIKNESKNLIGLNIHTTTPLSTFEFIRKTFFAFLRCKYIVCSFHASIPTRIRTHLLKNKHICVIGIGHGPVLLKTLVFNTPNCQENHWNKYLVTNNIEKKLFLDHGWNENKLVCCSLPRYDYCKKTPQDRKKIFVFFTWRLTFRRSQELFDKSLYIKNMTSFVKNKELNEILTKTNTDIVLGIHHATTDLSHLKFPDLPIKIADSSNLLYEINTADLFITDYSSIFFDFAYLGTPCIFYRLDENDANLSSLDIDDRINAKQQDDKIYNIFYDEKSVIDKIKYYINNNFELENHYKNKTEKLFYFKENNTKKFVEILETIQKQEHKVYVNKTKME